MDFIKINRQIIDQVALVELHRPKELNALNLQLMGELKEILKSLDEDSKIRVIVITGNDQSFAAGADIKEMSDKGAIDMLRIDQFSTWDQIRKIQKPLIAAVSGFALGGGCELAMTCDMIIASETARFGQPEIKIGVMPGAGGTQRLTRIIGKARSMEMILTGRLISADEAFRFGLVNKVVPVESYLDAAIKLAGQIAEMSPVAVKLAKESVNNSYEAPLSEALKLERKNFYLLFASKDQKEGMNAFVEKREPKFKGD